MRGTEQRQRFTALLGLLALALALGHVHESHAAHGSAHAADFGQTPGVSNDDAHHQHSARATLEAASCFTCRSHGDHAIARARRTYVPPTDPSDATRHRRSDATPRASATRLPATRAPPVLHLG